MLSLYQSTIELEAGHDNMVVSFKRATTISLFSSNKQNRLKSHSDYVVKHSAKNEHTYTLLSVLQFVHHNNLVVLEIGRHACIVVEINKITF